MDLSDKATRKLVKACIRGDRKSQKQLYETFYGNMLVVCIRYANDTNEAKDILHDGFIKVFVQLKKFEYKGSLEGWIRKIVVNTAIDFVRKKRDVLFEREEEFKFERSDPDAGDIEAEKYMKLKAELIMKLIRKLTPMYRTVFNMYVIDNHTHREIAQKLGINEGTSKSNFAKAKKKLRELFDKHINELEQ